MHAHRYLFKLIAVCCLILPLTGCWDIKEVQDMNYVTAIGIDYEDGQYVVYTQMLDFTTVAKAETGKSENPAQVWISKTKGKTINWAVDQVYNSSQTRTVWSHVSSIVISDKVLKSAILPKLDSIGRYQEVRMTPWVFGTSHSIEELFNTRAFFNMSPLFTILHEPIDQFNQRSIIAPIRYFDFLADLTEPGYTEMLPSLSIDTETWSTMDKRDPKMSINGGFSLYDEKLSGFLDIKDLDGLRWMQKETKRSPLLVTDGGIKGVVVLKNPKIKTQLTFVKGEPKFRIHVRLNGNVVEVSEDVSKTELEKSAANVVKEEILATFYKGMDTQSDVYSLEHLVFKQNPAAWKRLKQASGMSTIINKQSLESVMVDVHLEHTGMKLLPRKD
ncbi:MULTISPECIES: Ger(x)C family spore germination protein [Paenibacillus]|uniref:Ger(x)C family spore germination protein n=1 Tax=Paenibacillus TaxID=44249 RepID=UPI00203F90AC|nr:Ger(x)C family spore germination protein [Paenibacillus lactis]MCM3492258.1 Ger(x)C family spore germination protein [Paenibacillus lactis]